MFAPQEVVLLPVIRGNVHTTSSVIQGYKIPIQNRRHFCPEWPLTVDSDRLRKKSAAHFAKDNFRVGNSTSIRKRIDQFVRDDIDILAVLDEGINKVRMNCHRLIGRKRPGSSGPDDDGDLPDVRRA